MDTRKSQDIEAEQAGLIAEADTLRTRSVAEALTEDEKSRLEDCITKAEELQPELARVRLSERLDNQKTLLEQPSRPAPKFNISQPDRYRAKDKATEADAISLWLRSHTEEADTSTEAHYRSRQFGIQLGSPKIKLPCAYDFARYRVLSKLSNSEVFPQTYSSLVTEYMVLESPIISLVNSETTPEGNARTYFLVDDTALEADYITHSAGTEEVPDMPDVDVDTGTVDIATYTLRSGYHKISWQAERDNPINLREKMAAGMARSIARKVERDLLNATGDGSNGSMQGILDAATSLTQVAGWSDDSIEDLINSVGQQYQPGCIFVANQTETAEVRKALKDDVGRTLFDRTVEDPIAVETLKGFRWIVSNKMPAKTILFFQPKFYMLRMVEGQKIQTLVEKFAPHIATYTLFSFGGAWLGPDDDACFSIKRV